LLGSECYIPVPINDSKEMLEEVFSTVAEVADIYFPMDLKHACQSKGFAFVRFTSKADCERAIQEFDGAYLGVGREIRVTFSAPQSYFGQDESDVKKKPNKN
jgi:RNA recognition motif-containing protein